MRLLTGPEISSLLRNLTPENARQLLDALSTGLGSFYKEQNGSNKDDNKIIQPARVVFQSNQRHGANTVLAMPVSDTASTVVKVATVPAKGNIAGAITIYSGETGELEGVLNAAEITAFRTALASMTILTRWPAPRESNMVVFGSGKQAEWHIRLALLLVPGIKSITAINRGKKRLDDLEQDVLSDLRKYYLNVEFHTLAQEGTEDYAKKVRSILWSANIICGCTPSTEPLFTAKDLENAPEGGRFMSLIGSYKPHMQEIDTETLTTARKDNSKIYVDLKDACLEEAGELIKAGLGKDDLMEIGELFSQESGDGARKTLEKGRELTLFKCVGFGFMDLVISKALLKMAVEKDVGLEVETF